MAGTLPPRFDIFAPAVLEDPYPAYALLRRAGAVCRAGPATWVVTRYAEVSAFLHDPRLGHRVPEPLRSRALAASSSSDDLLSRALVRAQPNAAMRHVVSGLDPPDLPRVRQLVRTAISQEMIASATARASAHLDQLLDLVEESGRCDVVADIALPLHVQVASGLVAIPEADRPEVSRKAMALGRAIILIPFVTEARGNGEAEAFWLRDYMRELLAERKRLPGDDVVSRLLSVRHGELRLTDDEVVDNAVFLLFAGLETSVHLIASGCAALLDFPDEFVRLQADPSLAYRAVEEILRYDAPLQWVSRMTSAPVEVDGHTIKPGRIMLLLLASANRDEGHFVDPDRLNIGRYPNRHMSFGGGSHHCLGVSLARALGALMFQRLVRRFGRMQLVSTPVRRYHPNVRSFERLEVELTRA
jgi:cytochrome P450